jgi:predicted alpha/beta superfamily hydrolase
MEEELDPHIRASYNVNDKPAGLLGDSFGGTFTYYAFLQQSKLFGRYWMGSPGIFTTETDYVAKFEKAVAGDLVHDTKMYLSLGALEANGGVPIYEDMGRNFNATVSALNKHPNDKLTWKSQIYPGHTHTTVFTPALNDAFLYLYGPHLP